MTFLFLGTVCAEDVTDSNSTLQAVDEVSKDSIEISAVGNDENLLAQSSSDEILKDNRIDVDVSVNPNSGVRGSELFIMPKVTYNNQILQGNLTFYKNYDEENDAVSDKLVTISTAKGGNIVLPNTNSSYCYFYTTFKCDDGRDSTVDPIYINLIKGALVSLSVTNTTYGNTTALIKMDGLGDCILYINSVQYQKLQFTGNGSANINIKGFAASTNPYVATVSSDSKNLTARFTISKATPTITVSNINGNNSDIAVSHNFTASAQGTGKFTTNYTSGQFGIGETIVLNNSLLSAGKNTINVKYGGDENYTEATKEIALFVFGQTTVSLNASSQTPKYGQNITIRPNVLSDKNSKLQNGTVRYYIGETPISEALAIDKEFKFTVDRIGAFNITAKYGGYGYYKASEGTILINSQKADNKVNLTISEMVYGNNINVAISQAVDGIYTVVIGNANISVNVTKGTGSNNTVKLNLPAGKGYRASVSLNNGNYETTGNSTFDVVPAKNDVTLSVRDVLHGDNLTVTISNAIPGDYVVSINNNKINVKVNESGMGSNNTFVDLPVKDGYEAIVSLNNMNYTTSGSTKFNVGKIRSIIDIVSCNNITYPNDLIAEIYIEKMSNAFYEIFDENNGTVRKANMDSSNITVKGLNPGRYTLKITNAGNETIAESSESKTFNVARINITLISEVVVDKNNVTFTIQINKNATGLIEITIAGKKFYSPINNGVAVFSNDYVEGNYVANITYPGDKYCDFANSEVNFNVTKEKVILNETDIDVDVAGKDNEVTITVNVNSNATGFVEVAISGKKYYAPVNGGKAVFVNEYSAGTYVANVTYLGDASFKPANDVVQFTVVNVTPALQNTSISIEVTSKGTNVTVKVSVDESATGLIEVNVDGNAVYLPVNNGEVVYDAVVPVGNHTVTATYLGDGSFNPARSEANFTVSKDDVALNSTGVDLDVVCAGNNVTVTVGVNPKATGLIEVGIDGEKVYVPVNDGTAVFKVILPQGSYFVNATYLGDKNYGSNSSSKLFDVKDHVKKNTGVSAIPSVNGNTVTLTAKLDSNATGFVEIVISGKKYYAPVNGGKAVFVNEYSAGTYVANVTYLGDANFNSAGDVAQFTVVNVTPALQNTSISIDVASKGTNVTVKVSVDESATGLIEVNVDGNAVYLPVNNGKVVYDAVVPVGNHTVTATYLGDDSFNPAKSESDFAVSKESVTLNSTGVDLDVVCAGNNVTVTVGVNPKATGLIEVDIDGEKVYVPVNNGTAVFKVILPQDSYFVNATYLGDKNFASNSSSKSFDVKDRVKKNIDVSAIPSVNGNTVTLTAEVESDATGFVEVVISGKKYYAHVENGKAIFTNNYVAGTYVAKVTYLGDDNYNSAGDVAQFTIIKTDPALLNTSIGIDVASKGNDVTVRAFIDESASGLIEVNVDGNAVYLPVNNGEVVYNVSVSAGNHTVTATYKGDDKFNPNSASKVFEVSNSTKSDTFISIRPISDGNKINITVDVEANATGRVELNISGSVVYLKVENGTANYYGVLPDGNYNVTATYVGDDRYNSNSTACELKVSGIIKTVLFTPGVTVAYNAKKYIVITLKDENGKLLSNQKVSIKLNGKVKVLKLVNGKAKLTTKGLAPKTYKASVTFAGNGSYAKSAATVKIKVYKAKSYMTAKAKTFKKSTKVKKYVISLKNSNKKAIKKVKVTLKVKGKVYKAKTNSKGKAVFKINKLTKKGKFTAVIKFKGNKYYKAVTKKVKITSK